MKMLAKLSSAVTILFLFVSKIFVDADISPELTEIFGRLDALERKITKLESENSELKEDLRKQSESFDDYKSISSTKHDDFTRQYLTMQNDIKYIKYRDLKSIDTTLTQIASDLSSTKTNVTDSFAQLENDIKLKARFDDVARLDLRLQDAMDGLETLKKEVNDSNANVVKKIDNDVTVVRDALTLKMRTQTEVNNKQSKKLEDLENSVTALQHSLVGLDSILQNRTPPSFYAYMSYPVSVTGPQQRMVYDTIRTNNGNAYDNSTGIFIVPETGTYVFSWTCFSYVEEYIRLEIVVAGTIYGGTLSDTQETGDADTETGLIVVNARAGDEVFIRTQSNGPGNGRLYVEFESVSTFSGWKIS